MDLFKEARIEDRCRVGRFGIACPDHITKGTSDLIRSRLVSIQEVRIRPEGSHGYVMRFAKLEEPRLSHRPFGSQSTPAIQDVQSRIRRDDGLDGVIVWDEIDTTFRAKYGVPVTVG